MKDIIVFFCLIVYTSCFAQYSKNWVSTGTGKVLFFQNSYSLNTGFVNFQNINFSGGGDLVSASNGGLKFIFDNNRLIFDSKTDTIKNGYHILNFKTNNSIIFPKDDTSWQFLNSYFIDSSENEYGYFKAIKSWKNVYNYYGYPWPQLDKIPFGVYGTELNQNVNNKIYINGSKKNLLYYKLPYTLDFLDYVRTFDYNYAITAVRATTFPFSDTNRTFAIYNLEYKNNQLNATDSFLIRPQDYLPDSLRHLPNIGEMMRSGIQRAYISRNRDYVLTNFNVQVICNSIPLFNRNILFMIKVDPYTLKYIGSPQIVFDYSGMDMSIAKKTGVEYKIKSDNCKSIFSPNDSIIYLHLQEDQFLSGKIIDSKLKVIAWKFKTESLISAKSIYSVNLINSKPIILNTSINPFGGLTIYHDSAQNKIQKFIHYENANNPFLGVKKIQFFSTSSIGALSNPKHYTYDFVRAVADSINYKDCGAYFSIKNKSDLSNGISEFKWYIRHKDKMNHLDSFSTFDLPTQFIKESGTYIIKLHGRSIRGSGYSEWFIDTIIINIPKNPGVEFFAKDSVVCRYSALPFLNFSYSIDSSKINNYLWHFGDGITSVGKNPVHIYQNPGIYSVSLFYSNGFCDSTLVKNRYIHVVDAPKPGFNVTSKQGCSPFTVKFTDTVKLNVKQKDYFFSDEKLWENIEIKNPNFTHTFNKAGVYKAVQRLTGFTGCVIQTDSVIFNISKGLTNIDTIHVINATIENKNTLIYWKRQNAAIKYQILKNGINYLQTTDTFFNESIPYINDIVYNVVGIDSCNNICAKGREGKPILLEGNTIENNEVSFVNFSPYLRWPTPNIQYKIQKLILGSWVTIQGQQTNDLFSDKFFLEKGGLQACYRIEANDINYPDIITHSNELCIPYNPTIFIPSAFSPNNDGVNDIFEPIYFGITQYSLTVYNAWGQEIFKGMDNQGWNGTNEPVGVYLVKVNYIANSGQKHQQNITVTLLR